MIKKVFYFVLNHMLQKKQQKVIKLQWQKALLEKKLQQAKEQLND